MNHLTTTPERVAEAIRSIELGNNGYADIGGREEVAAGVRAEGYTVILTTGLHGQPTYKGFTKRAIEAMRNPSRFDVPLTPPSVIKRFCLNSPPPDYEGAILARQERMGFYD